MASKAPGTDDVQASGQRVVLVTGAAGNLGRACVADFARQGAIVVAQVRGTASSGPARGADEPMIPGAAVMITGDLRPSLGELPRVVEEIRAVAGRVDVIVNNAASQSTGALPALTAADWRDMLESSLESAAMLTSALVPAMPPGSSIVNIASVEAASAFPAHVHYAAAKAGLVAYTRGLALELAPRGIRANAVAPGLIERQGLAQDWPAGDRWWRATAPSGAPVLADDVAAVVAFLASPAARGVNGTVLPVDGGWSASARLCEH